MVPKNIRRKNIGAPKMRKNYDVIQLSIFPILQSNIRLFSIAPCKVIAPNLHCFIFSITSLLLFLVALSIVIALTTIAIVIVVDLFNRKELMNTRNTKIKQRY